MADANRAPVRRPPTAAKRGRLNERQWADVDRAVRIARTGGVTLKVHGVEITGLRKLQPQVPRQPGKVLHKPAETAAPKEPPPPAADDIVELPPPISKRKERSAQRLLAFQQQKRAVAFGAKYGNSPERIARHELIFQRTGYHLLLLRAKLRWLLWRAWARYRPIYGGPVLGYTSLREQYVYKRAARLYAAALRSDPGKSSRPLAVWLCRMTPMVIDLGSQPPSPRSAGQTAKKPRTGGAKPRSPQPSG